ncbi:hypothetical protein HC766_09525 [Candidatus Gracilibacteria bacterium]|nr:hypothetical protein [Candidatus Gracilibacteria bacterium]
MVSPGIEAATFAADGEHKETGLLLIEPDAYARDVRFPGQARLAGSRVRGRSARANCPIVGTV